jgi:tetratricopeptide (TPR) repeat protein
MRFLLIVCAFILAASVSAPAQTLPPPSAPASDPADLCRTASGEASIVACNRAIASGRFKGAALAEIYINRGKQLSAAADYDRAIADFDRAIEIDLRNPAGFAGRGAAWLAKGEASRAIAEFDRAIRVDAAYAPAYTGRALAYERRGDPARARSDFNAALALPLKSEADRWAHDTARERLAATGGQGAPALPPQPALPPASKSDPVAASAATSDPNAAARHDYEVATQSGTREGWEEFLRRYPSGFYADLARAQLIKLTSGSGVTQTGQPEKTRAGAPPEPARAAVAPSPPVADSMTDERRDYALAERVGTLEAWDWYLRQYSEGFYADLARAQRAKLIGAIPAKTEPGIVEPVKPAARSSTLQPTRVEPEPARKGRSRSHDAAERQPSRREAARESAKPKVRQDTAKPREVREAAKPQAAQKVLCTDKGGCRPVAGNCREQKNYQGDTIGIVCP